MKKNKKLSKAFWYIFLILFMSFATLYVAGKAGYYEYTQNRKKVFTEEAIKKFEQDVSDGKEVDISNYLVTKEDFQGKKKRVGVLVSEFIGDYMKLGVDEIFKMLNNLVEN